ncbi:hypothetical protein OG571_45905 (plasmid) [Streptomyces sp. NBC_01369]|uniref:hypothetical protein n=1 Tax=Streptomyces sp. NBC_01369 TaxID=2903842 RepID=UPI002F90E73D
MQTEVLVALIGVSATVAAAAIAYPVGRGVARRQAKDQHDQWLRTQRQSASSRLADGATEFIELAAHAWEAVARPEYAHTRRRDIESRKHLDAALYEPLKKALREMHNALPAVALHGPEKVTTAGQDLYNAAMNMTGALLHLDAACVQRSVISGGFQFDSLSQQHLQAALDDLDSAYARLAAPLGLPEFSARAEATLRSSAALNDLVRLGASLDDPAAATAILNDLRRAAADDAELGRYIEPFLAYQAIVELRSLARAVGEGQQIGVDQQLAAVAAAIPALLGVFTTTQQFLQDPLPDGVDLDELPPELTSALEPLSAMMQRFDGSLAYMQQIQQHLAVGDELAATLATTPTDPVTSLLAGLAWDSSLGHLGIRAAEEFASLDAGTLMPQMTSLLTPLFEITHQHANADLVTAQESLNQARADFIAAARETITA